jgi:alpha-aminoadipate carrier protein LysW
MEVANCIGCNTEIRFRQSPKIGMLVSCDECGAELEVVWLDPLELDWPFIDDDWDEDEDEETLSLYEDY